MFGLPLNFIRPFLGPRIIKTGLAVFLTLVLFHWVGSSYASFAALAAILAVQPSLVKAKQVFVEQLIGNLIGGAVAIVLVLWLGHDPWVVALGVILVLGLLHRIGQGEAAGLAVAVVLIVMNRDQSDFVPYAIARIGTISGGMFIGFLVNRYVLPPDFTRRLHDELTAAEGEIQQFGQRLLLSLKDPESFSKAEIKEQMSAIHKRLQSAELLLQLAQESRGYPYIYEQKARSTMFVFVERMADVHKIALQVDGLRNGEVRLVTAALCTTLAYEENIFQAAMGQTLPESHLAAAFRASLTELERYVRDMVSDESGRDRGLALSGLTASVRHMGWRAESLDRLIRTRAGS